MRYQGLEHRFRTEKVEPTQAGTICCVGPAPYTELTCYGRKYNRPDLADQMMVLLQTSVTRIPSGSETPMPINGKSEALSTTDQAGGQLTAASSLFVPLQAEVTRLWNSAVVTGDSREAARIAAASNALQRAKRLMDDQSSIG